MRDTYAPNLLSVPGKIVVLVFTGVLLATGIYGSMQVREAFTTKGNVIWYRNLDRLRP